MNGFLYMLVYLVMLYFVLRSVQHIVNIKRSKQFLSNITVAKNRSETKKIIILIPIFSEVQIIRETVQYFYKITTKIKNVSVIFITTSKEGKPQSNPSYKLIEQSIKGRMSIVHYPYKRGEKAHQLNYAIKKIIKNLNSRDTTTYFAVFDADSRPDVRGIEYVLHDTSSEMIYQMFSKYLTNFNKISYINKANALFQTRWSLCFELPTTLSNYNSRKTKSLMYFIGHGLFIRSDFFNRNMFPENTLTEDIALGYACSFKGTLCKPVPYFDNCSVPYSIITNIKQTARWFSGELYLLNEYIKNTNKKRFIKDFILTLKRYFYLAQWLFGPPLILTIGAFSITKKDVFLMLLALFSLYIYIYVLHKSIEFIFKENIKIDNKIYLFILFKSLINFIGPFYAIFKVCLSISGVIKYEFQKTPR